MRRLRHHPRPTESTRRTTAAAPAPGCGNTELDTALTGGIDGPRENSTMRPCVRTRSFAAEAVRATSRASTTAVSDVSRVSRCPCRDSPHSPSAATIAEMSPVYPEHPGVRRAGLDLRHPVDVAAASTALRPSVGRTACSSTRISSTSPTGSSSSSRSRTMTRSASATSSCCTIATWPRFRACPARDAAPDQQSAAATDESDTRMRAEVALERVALERDVDPQHLGDRWLDFASLNLRPVALRNPSADCRCSLSQI